MSKQFYMAEKQTLYSTVPETIETNKLIINW